MADIEFGQPLAQSPSQAPIPVVQPAPSDLPPSEGTFNAAQFLNAAGMKLLGAVDAKGQVRVLNSDGQEGTLDINQIMGKAGIPSNVDVQYNDPNTALNVSPVGFGDRIRLALGNAKGQMNYLKSSYEDAKLTPDGDMVVKDKGIWHRVDAKKLGDGTGWDLAKEMAGDLADLTGVGINAAATIAGAAASGLPTAGAGSVAGAAAGSAMGTLATAALGRIVGTYEATPDELVKDMAMDALLGAAGQGVALGAKEAITSTLGQSMKNFAKNAAAPVKAQIAGYMEQFMQVPQDMGMRMLNRAERIDPILKDIVAMAKEPQKLSSAGNLLDNAVDAGLEAGGDEAIVTAAMRKSLAAGRGLLENAQKNLSRVYRQKTDAALAIAPENLTSGQFGQHVAEGVNKIISNLPEGVVNVVKDEAGNISRYAVADAATMASKMSAQGVDETLAKGIRTRLQSYLNGAHSIVAGEEQKVGKDALLQGMNHMDALDDFYYKLVDNRPEMQKIFQGVTNDIKSKMMQAAGPEVSGALGARNQIYKDYKPAVEMAQSALEAGEEGIQGTLRTLFGKTENVGVKKDQFKQLGTLMNQTGDGAGQAAYDHLMDTVTATAFARSVPKSSLTNLAARAAVGGAVGYGSDSPTAGIGAALLTSPRNAARIAIGSAKGLNVMGSMMRKMSEPVRNRILQSPEQFGALMSQALGQGAGYDPSQGE